MSLAQARSYHHGDLRRALLDATRELLVEGGLEAATLRAVARRAGVSNRAPYHHFSDKCCLLAAVATEGFGNLCSEMDRALARSDQNPRARLEALLHSYLTFAESHPGEFQVMFWHEVCDRELFHERGEKASEAFRYLLDAIAALSAEAVDEERLVAIGVTAWSTVHGFATLRSQGAFREPDSARSSATSEPEVPAHVGEERLADELCARTAASLERELQAVS